jgi:ABC-2 type transport system ATP-binding protein
VKGQVCVLGHDPATTGGAWRDRVGVVLQKSQPKPGLSVRECVALYAGLYRAPRRATWEVIASAPPTSGKQPTPGR